jgi:SAM-dependent methyltransferase
MEARRLVSQAGYHQTRFDFDPRRDVLWRTLCHAYFGKLIRPDFHVLELGAGYANFINHVHCARRTAVDHSPLLEKYAAPGVTARVGDVTKLDFLADASVDFAFASNLFEHLTQADFAAVLAQLRTKLKRDGTLNILQPNYRLSYKEYFDDYTHISIYSHLSLCDFLRANGYRILYARPGFLPFSIKSRLPVSPWMIRLYLMSPWKPFAKQMFVRAQPADEAGRDGPPC